MHFYDGLSNSGISSEYSTEQIGMFDTKAGTAGQVMALEADFLTNQMTLTDLLTDKQTCFCIDDFIQTIHEDDRKRFKQAFFYSPKSEKHPIDVEFRVCVNCIIKERRIKGFVHRVGDSLYAAGLCYDVDSVRAQTARIEYFEKYDVKTGLYNTHTLDIMFEDISKFGMYPQTVIIADIDSFKNINDTLGYRAGNTLIKSVADVLKECFFDAELLARISGGEYCAVYAGKSRLEIENKINEAQMLFHSMYLNLIKAEVSFGYAVSKNHSDFCTLYSTATQKLRRERNASKVLSAQSVIESLNKIIAQKAQWGKRQTRLQSLSMQIAEPLGCTAECESVIKVLAKIANIGFIGIDENLIKRRTALGENEWIEYKKHIEIGREIIATIDEVAVYEPLYLDIFKRYDEWQDAIALPSRIVAGAMGFDDIATSAPNISFSQIKNRMIKKRGSLYCPDVVDAIMDVAKHYA